MDPTARALTRYFSDIQERANLKDFAFGSAAPFDEVPLAEVTSGSLSDELTAEIFQRAAKGTWGSKPPKAVDLVISLVTLEQGNKKHGLLLLPASLKPDGTLAADLESAPPWIPASRLSASGIADLDVMVGPQATFWKYRTNAWPEQISKVESWGDAVRATQRFFAAVATPELNAAATAAEAEIVVDRCFISTEKVIVANGSILNLYKFLARSDDAAAPSYERLLGLGSVHRFDSDSVDTTVTTLKLAAREACGSMSDEHPLTPSQRRAVHAFTLDGRDGYPVTAVSGPPGTGKTTMLQSVVASTIVRHALESKPAPLIVGSSTNNQAVTNIIDSFNSVTKDEPGPMDHRWLPRAAEDGATDQPLSGLATYCPAQQRAPAARTKGYLLEDNRKGGVYTEYSDADYVAQATAFFLDKLRAYSDSTGGVVQAASSIDDAAGVLLGALRRVDESRLLLIEAKSQLGESPAARDLVAIEEQLGRLEFERDQCATRLAFWTDLQARASSNPNRRPGDDYFVIAQNRDPYEPAKNLATLAEYVGFYQHWVAEWSRRIDEFRGKRQAASDQVVRESAPSNEAEIALGWIQRIGNLDDEAIEKLANASSLLELDKLLDTTARYIEFWLAVHLYEAQWLQAASGDDLIPKNDRWRTSAELMDKYWHQLPALTPCLVMTAYQLPKYFQLSGKGATSTFDTARADLLIVDEAGQVDTSVGAAAFAVTKRALVVGDVLQLAPVWSIEPEPDAEIASVHGFADRWDELKKRGLTSSDHSSVMAAASAASRWRYGAEGLPGLFLSEHFRCHDGIIEFCNALLYKGMLVPSRPLGGYKLTGITPSPFLFREVPGSLDKRSGSSRVNEVEAVAIASWIVENYDFLDAIYNADGANPGGVIGVVTPFSAQASLITRKLRELGSAELASRITSGTAHGLQGAERPVVLFSSVYGDNSAKASFVDSTLELMNVAVSRAKDLFIVFGGSARWKDDGPVFSLVRRFATRDECDFSGGSEPPAEVRIVDRSEPGYAIGKDLVAQWTAAAVVAEQPKLTVKALNTALEAAGLIERTDDGPAPTLAGAELGVAAYEGENTNGDRYVNVIYSPAAQDALAAMWKEGRLPLG